MRKNGGSRGGKLGGGKLPVRLEDAKIWGEKEKERQDPLQQRNGEGGKALRKFRRREIEAKRP